MKCIVKDCINQTHEGKFIGELCMPCHEFVTTENGVYSQAYRNTRRPWAGLTDEEIEILSYKAESNTWTAIELAETKLKEKNT